MARLGRVLVVAIVVLGAFAFSGGSAQAHNIVSWTGNGCLLQLHRNDIGALNARSGTCDHDNYWRGTVYDNHAPNDGHCVVAILDGIVMAASCNTSGNSFTFLDPQRNYSAFTWICDDDYVACRGATNVNF
jgi:hypothetical protein